jgi:hypothetical protein
MAMHHCADVSMALVYFRVYSPLDVALGSGMDDWLGILDIVCNEIPRGHYVTRSDGMRHEKDAGFGGMAKREMTKCVQDIVIMKNMRSINEFPEALLQHGVFEGGHIEALGF